MNSIIRNILAVIAGLIVGSAVNMGIIAISGSIIPPPEGADVTKMDGLKASMHLFEPRHFIFPFLAHAFGMKFAMSIALFFLIGGIINVFMLPSPLWFTIIDLAGAYIPMGWLGGKMASGKK